MNILSDWQACLALHRLGKSIGFVPTMGNLHAGHASLIERSKKDNDVTVVSIYVNPTQFNQQNDFDKYPRTLEQDKTLLNEFGVDYLLLPTEQLMYPDQYQVQVTETEISRELEGEYRPGHFNGMLTVVLKLLNLVRPTRAYFGEKDFQQLALVKKMVNALLLPIEIVGCPTLRASDQLALSSRNSRLTEDQRRLASVFPALLSSRLSLEEIAGQLQAQGFKVDYIVEKWGRRLGAVWLGDVRLIDNIPLTTGE